MVPKPFRFLDLPPEIRKTIYDLWIPSVLHVSMGFRGVRLQHFELTHDGLFFQAISFRPFFLNRQFYQEFCHALFTRATWSFSSADLLPKVLARMPPTIRSRIRHISLRLTAQGTLERETPIREDNDRMAIMTFQMCQRVLRTMPLLQTLIVNINLSDFHCRENNHLTKNLARGDREAVKIAANCVADFTWEGLQTRVPFCASNLTGDFMDTLRLRCGEANVKVVWKHKDRYAGQMVDVVVSQCPVEGMVT
jgi:hypothetical protein